MNGPFLYKIRVKGHLPDTWSEWFGELEIVNGPGGEATLAGRLEDQAALLGLLNRIVALNITLISVERVSPQNTEAAI
jgi:hypothetical protein